MNAKDCCDTFKKVLTENIPKGWKLKNAFLKDPDLFKQKWELTFYHSKSGFVGDPTVTVTIVYGSKGG